MPLTHTTPITKYPEESLPNLEGYASSLSFAEKKTICQIVGELDEGIFRLTKEGMCNFGQVIYEKNQKTGVEWVHYGNDPAEFFTEEIVKMINRKKFMQSINGGKSYSVVSNI